LDAFSIATRLTLDDWRAYQRACASRIPHETSTARLARLAAFIVIGVGFALLCNWLGRPLQFPSIVAGVLLVTIPFWLSWRSTKQRVVPDDPGAFLGEQAYELGPTGLRVRRQGIDSFAHWSQVRSVTVTPEHLFVWIDRFQAFVLPLRQLPSDSSAEAVRRQIEQWRGAVETPQPSVAASALESPDAASAATNCDRDNEKWAWSATLMRLLALQRVAATPSHGHTLPILVLSLVCMVVWFVLDWLGNQPDPAFYIYGFPAIAWYVLMLVAVAAVAARLSIPAARFGRVLLLALAVTPVALVASFLIGSYLPRPWGIALVGVTVLYLLMYAVRGLTAITGNDQPRAITAGALIVLMFLWVGIELYVDPTVWMQPEERDTAYDRSWDEAESLLFSQPQRIDEALDAVEPSDEHAPDLFFLGFAGFGEQRVFAEEIKLAAQVVGGRYGSADRSVLLLNDRRDRSEWPLASPTALRYALRGIATKMNVDKDVLFLSLSSHGSEDASLSVTNGALMLHDLTAPDLALALGESGIKWRVIVISACYSGSFIEELRNPQTIVITASAADRSSFGCADDRDLTYFGEAFYRDALPKAHSLRAAFEAAKAEIAVRERRERVTPSRPQAFFGNEIEKRLKALERPVPPHGAQPSSAR